MSEKKEKKAENLENLENFGSDFLSKVIFKLRKKTILYSFSVGAVVGILCFLVGANYG